MAIHNLDHLLEEAFKQWVAEYVAANPSSPLAGVNTVIGLESTLISRPALLIYASTQEWQMVGGSATGDVAVELNIELQTNLDDTTRAAASALAGALRDLVVRQPSPGGDMRYGLDRELNTLASPVSGLNCRQVMAISGENSEGDDETGKYRVHMVKVTMHCAPA